ncbi:MAG: aryl-sulfate sulfotransferase, partial [Patulibacter sp.]|nr:aryl-sulfate sulfotransferase [Patulibacter sp.]
YQPVKHDLRQFGGPEDGSVVDGIVQEIDVATGLVVFEWHSLDHVGPEEGTSNLPSESGQSRFDYFHINSVDEDVDGGLVVSARRTDAVYKIDRRTGEVAWRLGGNRSDFELGKGVEFFLQHDARVQSDGSIRIFDNSSEPEGGRSRDITVALDHRRGTATLVRDVGHPGTKLFAATQGNAQPLPDGGILLGWGSQGRVSEVGPKGGLRFDAELPDGFDSYRFYKGPWVGTPETSPRLAVEDAGDDRTDVYASFNGATEVDRWEVLAGDSDDALEPIGSAKRSGFETRIRVPGRPSRVTVRALDAEGEVLGTAKPIGGAAR